MAGLNVKSSEGDRIARTIHVGGIGGLGEEIKEQDVADFFGQNGEVTGVRISGRFCWVEFADVRAAHSALSLDGQTTGGHHLRVSQSKSAIHSNGLRGRGGARDAAPGPSGAEGVAGLTDAQKHAALANLYASTGAAPSPYGYPPAPVPPVYPGAYPPAYPGAYPAAPAAYPAPPPAPYGAPPPAPYGMPPPFPGAPAGMPPPPPPPYGMPPPPGGGSYGAPQPPPPPPYGMAPPPPPGVGVYGMGAPPPGAPGYGGGYPPQGPYGAAPPRPPPGAHM